MVKSIMKYVLFLGHKSELATTMDGQMVEYLLDTSKLSEDGCVGIRRNWGRIYISMRIFVKVIRKFM
jgi:hypothetical protein